MVILGLTGSIGMGKSTAADLFRQLGIPVHDADRVVHRLLGPGGAAVSDVGAAFPGVVRNGAVDRAVLGGRVFSCGGALRRLESILHPLVSVEERRFLSISARRGASIVVLDIPLLFETGGERRCDAAAVVWAPRFLQERRVLRRSGMTSGRFAQIVSRQMDDSEKGRRADFVVATGLGRAWTLREIRKIVTVMRGRHPRRWPPLSFMP